MEWLAVVVAQLLAAGAIYGGIRADLKHLHDSTTRAHERIDYLLERRKT